MRSRLAARIKAHLAARLSARFKARVTSRVTGALTGWRTASPTVLFTGLITARAVAQSVAARAASRRRRWIAAGWVTSAVSMALLGGCASTPPNPNPLHDAPLQIASLDLPRYMGRWYIIANIPYVAERKFVASYAQWALRSDGKVDDSYYGRERTLDGALKHYQFVDTVVPGSGNGKWRVQLFWPVTVTQLTLYVDPDYRYTILGYPDKSLGWIFSRDKQMDEATYQSLLQRLADMGYDTTRFKRVVQVPAQLGMPGFQSPDGH